MCKICIETERKCKICGITKPIEEFRLQKNRWRDRICMLCEAIKKRVKKGGTTYEIELKKELEKQALEAKGLRKCKCKQECNQVRPIEDFVMKRGKRSNVLKDCINKRRRESYTINPEPAKANAAKWRVENPEKNKEHKINWEKNNPEKRQARKKEVGTGYRKNKTVIALYERQKGICPLCNTPLHKDFMDLRHHVDHIYPVSKAKKDGWTKEQINHIDNLQVVHANCNLRKGDRIDYEYLFEEAA